MTKHQMDTRPRRRWIIAGPGIVIAILLALQVAINNHKTSSGPPIIERQVVGAESTQGFIPAPEIGYILKHSQRLRLTNKQIASLKVLQVEWDEKSTPLKDQMNRAASEFQRFMEQAKGKVSVQEIQSHAGAVSELSRQVSSLRRIYWQKALQVLNQEQRKIIEDTKNGNGQIEGATGQLS